MAFVVLYDACMLYGPHRLAYAFASRFLAPLLNCPFAAK
jgi:hypothetical protein